MVICNTKEKTFKILKWFWNHERSARIFLAFFVVVYSEFNPIDFKNFDIYLNGSEFLKKIFH